MLIDKERTSWWSFRSVVDRWGCEIDHDGCRWLCEDMDRTGNINTSMRQDKLPHGRIPVQNVSAAQDDHDMRMDTAGVKKEMAMAIGV